MLKFAGFIVCTDFSPGYIDNARHLDEHHETEIMIQDARPKYLLIAENIEARIKRGDWNSAPFPSIRDVADEHHVSIVTASRALQSLKDRGLLRTVDRSGYFIESSAIGLTQRYALCQRTSPGPWQNAIEAGLRYGFSAAAEHNGSVLDAHTLYFPNEYTAVAVERMAKVARAQKFAGIFFRPSKFNELQAEQDLAFINACANEGIPVVLLERNLRGSNRTLLHDLVCGDDFAGSFAMTEHLIQLGRQRIAFITSNTTSSHEARLAGYLTAMNQYGMPTYVFTENDQLPARISYHQLTDQVLNYRTDGIACYHDSTAIGLMMELMSRGMQIPDDFAITGFGDLPLNDAFPIGLTTYQHHSESIALEAYRLMARRIDEPTAVPLKVTVPGRLITRGSTHRLI